MRRGVLPGVGEGREGVRGDVSRGMLGIPEHPDTWHPPSWRGPCDRVAAPGGRGPRLPRAQHGCAFPAGCLMPGAVPRPCAPLPTPLLPQTARWWGTLAWRHPSLLPSSPPSPSTFCLREGPWHSRGCWAPTSTPRSSTPMAASTWTCSRWRASRPRRWNPSTPMTTRSWTLDPPWPRPRRRSPSRRSLMIPRPAQPLYDCTATRCNCIPRVAGRQLGVCNELNARRLHEALKTWRVLS